jgi:acyl-CoA synthetase (AMP-forming)/AMP-acid ligase II
MTVIPERVGELTGRAEERWGEREFARLGDTALSFAEFRRWSDAIATDLVTAGVRPGDRVMILLVNRLEVLGACAAAWRIGAIATPVVAIYRSHELREIVRDARPAAVLTSTTLGPRRLAEELDGCLAGAGVEPVARYLVRDGLEPVDGWTRLADFDARPDPAVRLPEPAAAGEECLRLYTSGSTSAPKGVRLNSRTVIPGGRQFHDRIGVGDTDTGLALAPLAHIAGLLAGAIVPLTCGASAVILPRWDVAEALRVIHERRITWSLGAAVFLRDLVGEYERRRDDGLHVLARYVSGGANTAPELIERAEAVGMWAARTYGMTEAAGVIALARADATLDRRAHWDGLLADNAEARIVDGVGGDLPDGAEGRILVRGDQLLLGYTDPEANRTQFVDGWFDTGDLGVMAADRWVRVTGRTKDIINRGGEKFAAADIEHVLHRHPSVAAAAVLGVPHERLGEAVCAFIVPVDSAAPPTPEALAGFMLGQDIAKAKVPAEWHIVDALPTTASGKVQKHLLLAER